MKYCKLQIGCMMVILYIVFNYYKERKRFKQKYKISIFDSLLLISIVCIFFDGLTAYTVNNLEFVNSTVNMVLHLFFLLSLDTCIFLMFMYMISVTVGLPKLKIKRILFYTPFVVNLILVIVNMPTLKYYEGELSNYSMGVSAYTCFIMAVFILL